MPGRALGVTVAPGSRNAAGPPSPRQDSAHTQGQGMQSRPAQKSSQKVFFKLGVQIMTFFYPAH